jgi:hypothetical protein
VRKQGKRRLVVSNCLLMSLSLALIHTLRKDSFDVAGHPCG